MCKEQARPPSAWATKEKGKECYRLANDGRLSGHSAGIHKIHAHEAFVSQSVYLGAMSRQARGRRTRGVAASSGALSTRPAPNDTTDRDRSL